MSQPNPRFQCRHIRPSGHRCGSPTLRNENFCYYHHETRRPIQNLKNRRAFQNCQASFNLPEPTAEAVPETVDEIVAGPIAPESDLHRKPHEKNLEQILLEQ